MGIPVFCVSICLLFSFDVSCFVLPLCSIIQTRSFQNFILNKYSKINGVWNVTNLLKTFYFLYCLVFFKIKKSFACKYETTLFCTLIWVWFLLSESSEVLFVSSGSCCRSAVVFVIGLEVGDALILMTTGFFGLLRVAVLLTTWFGDCLDGVRYGSIRVGSSSPWREVLLFLLLLLLLLFAITTRIASRFGNYIRINIYRKKICISLKGLRLIFNREPARKVIKSIVS